MAAKTDKKLAKLTKFENRVRFNWGFWDGVADNRSPGSGRIDGLNRKGAEVKPASCTLERRAEHEEKR